MNTHVTARCEVCGVAAATMKCPRAIALLAVVCLSFDALCGRDPEMPVNVRGTWLLSVDNDSFKDSDDHYSSGVQIGWVPRYLRDYADAAVPAFLVSPLRRLPRNNENERQRFLSYSLSHRIFTPSDITQTDLIPNDMPYSGLLWGTVTAGAQDDNSMDAFSPMAGVVGPAAFGEEVQKHFHRLIDSAHPRGWSNQLHNEPLLNIAYEHRRRLATFGSQRSWGGDLIGQGALAAGNLLTNMTLGLGARWGWRVPDDFALPPQFFGEETLGLRPFTASSAGRGAWFFTLLNVSSFAHAVFWDGNTFRSSHSIDYERWIARTCVGIHVRAGRWGVSFAFVTTTVPWTNPQDRDYQRYGRLGVTMSY